MNKVKRIKKFVMPRAPADSKRGRQITQAKGSQFSDDSRISPEVREYNKRVEAAKQEKKLNKQQGRQY